jgi:hypothetical protein
MVLNWYIGPATRAGRLNAVVALWWPYLASLTTVELTVQSQPAATPHRLPP